MNECLFLFNVCAMLACKVPQLFLHSALHTPICHTICNQHTCLDSVITFPVHLLLGFSLFLFLVLSSASLMIRIQDLHLNLALECLVLGPFIYHSGIKEELIWILLVCIDCIICFCHLLQTGNDRQYYFALYVYVC